MGNNKKIFDLRANTWNQRITFVNFFVKFVLFEKIKYTCIIKKDSATGKKGKDFLRFLYLGLRGFLIVNFNLSLWSSQCKERHVTSSTLLRKKILPIFQDILRYIRDLAIQHILKRKQLITNFSNVK